jgi:hypothetical protein
MHHATEHVPSWNSLRDSAVRIDRLQAQTFQRAMSIKEPPWDAVHRYHHTGLGADERDDGLRHAFHGGRLDGNDDNILLTERTRIVTRVHRHRSRIAVFGQAQPLGLQRLKRRAAGQHVDRLIGQRELRAKITADRAGADNANTRHVIRFGRKDRCGRWCG